MQLFGKESLLLLYTSEHGEAELFGQIMGIKAIHPQEPLYCLLFNRLKNYE
jgi:hypothetical protein